MYFSYLSTLFASKRHGIMGRGTEYVWILGDAAALIIADAGQNGWPPLPLASETLFGMIGILPSSGIGSTAYNNFLNILEANKGLNIEALICVLCFVLLICFIADFDPALSAGNNTFIAPYTTGFYDSIYFLTDAFQTVSWKCIASYVFALISFAEVFF